MSGEGQTENYISLLEKEILVCKAREQELLLDRSDLVEKIRIIHGILEDKQRQVAIEFSNCSCEK